MTARLCAMALLVAALSVATSARSADTLRLPPISFGGSFTLVDHNGRTRTDRDFRGNFLLVYFGYTYCPDICPTGLQTISGALDLLSERSDRVQPVLVTVDPVRDTPAVLKDYVSNFHPSLIGLTGTEAQIRGITRAYKVHRRKVILPETKDDGYYLVDHSSIAYLMGPDGSWRTLFPHGTTAESMAAALERYLK